MTIDDVRELRKRIITAQRAAERELAAHRDADTLRFDACEDVLIAIASGDFADPQHAAALIAGQADGDLQ